LEDNPAAGYTAELYTWMKNTATAPLGLGLYYKLFVEINYVPQ